MMPLIGTPGATRAIARKSSANRLGHNHMSAGATLARSSAVMRAMRRKRTQWRASGKRGIGPPS